MMEYIDNLILENARLKLQLEEAQRRMSNSETPLGVRTLVQRVVDQKRREEIMMAAEELKASGAELSTLPHPEFPDLEGMNLTTLAKSGLVRGSAAWLSRRSKSGDISHHRLNGEVWFDALDIKEAQGLENKPTIAGKVRPIGYTRRHRISRT